MIKLCTPLSAEAVRAISANTIPDGLAHDFALAAAGAIGTVAPDGTVFVGVMPSGDHLYAMPRDEGREVNFDDAQRYLKISNAGNYYGHVDWRVPSPGELRMIFNHHAEIGKFDTQPSSHWYRTSDAWGDRMTCISFRDGDEDEFTRDGYFSLRFVRTEKRPDGPQV